MCTIFIGLKVAERVGFEPTLPFRVNTLSKRAPSATRPSLRKVKDLQQVPSNQVARLCDSLNGGLCCPVSKHDIAVYQGTTVSSQRQPSNRALVYARFQMAVACASPEDPSQDELNAAVCRMREKGLKATGANAAIRAINAYLH